MKGTLKLGLNIPLFVASMIAIAAGTFTGIIGIWGFAAQKLVIPEWIKVSHAHVSWWAVLILLAALVTPSLPLASWFRKFLLATALICPGAWIALGQAGYYHFGFKLGKYLMPVFEILLFIALLGVALVAIGFRVPFIVVDVEPRPGKYDIMSSVEVDRRIFLVPTLVAVFGVLVGFTLAGMFKATGQPIRPAALVQLHDHLVIMSASSIIALLALRVLNVSESIFKIAVRIMEIALPLVAIGLIAFIALGFHSLVWVVRFPSNGT